MDEVAAAVVETVVVEVKAEDVVRERAKNPIRLQRVVVAGLLQQEVVELPAALPTKVVQTKLATTTIRVVVGAIKTSSDVVIATREAHKETKIRIISNKNLLPLSHQKRRSALKKKRKLQQPPKLNESVSPQLNAKPKKLD